MNVPRRNDPCPCSSGNKYKKCCLTGSAETRASHLSASQRHPSRINKAAFGFGGRASSNPLMYSSHLVSAHQIQSGTSNIGRVHQYGTNRQQRGADVLGIKKMLGTFSKLSDTNAIVVTIDDGPNPETTPLLLSILARYQAKANFFVSGKNVAANPELAKLIVSAGHGLFSHGFSHRDFSTLTQDEIVDELDKTERLLSEFRPAPTPYLIRLPYGRGTDVSHVNDAVAKWSNNAAFIQWNLSPAEWLFVENCQTPIDVSNHCKNAVHKLSQADWGGGIILLHDWPTTVEDEIPETVSLRPYFCAALLEKVLITVRDKNLNYALL